MQAAGQTTDNGVLFGLSTPVALAVVVFFIYSLIAFRERDTAAVLDGPPVRGHAGVQLWWIVTTTTIVLFLAGYGTVRMLADGAGGGQGPNPIAKPTSSVPALPVQVIAQQWKFTFRFPTYGGVETQSSRDPGQPADRVPRDVAGRDPLVLGLPARRQGRRQPGRRQRRLRHRRRTR